MRVAYAGVDAGGRLDVTSANIVNETFDDETVVVNLDAGTYFSLTRLASAVWVALPGSTVDEIVDQLVDRYDAGREAIEPPVRAFVEALVDEGLVGPADGRTPARTPLPPVPDTFEAPAFEKFDDMQDLLLLDPIHDVDPSGWPTRP